MTGLLALVAAAVFTGAAAYINAAEQPARLLLDERAALMHWKPAYERGFSMQASLAVIGFLLGMATWWSVGGWLWAVASFVLLANWPFTLLAIMPVNRQLTATAPEAADAATRALLVRWGRLHGVRTALGAAATALFLLALQVG